MKQKLFSAIAIIITVSALTAFVLKKNNPTRPLLSYLPTAVRLENKQRAPLPVDNSLNDSATPSISFVKPRDNVPTNSPRDYGFWSFAVPVPKVLSRSGQPTIREFQWLKQNNWKSVINLRTYGEHGEVALDSQLAGFEELGFKYFEIPIEDGSAPTDWQGEQFLQFVTNPENQPVHVHCRAGVGRTGTMIALYRYRVQDWPMEMAIEEAEGFRSGVSAAQRRWLLTWAQNHPAE